MSGWWVPFRACLDGTRAASERLSKFAADCVQWSQSLHFESSGNISAGWQHLGSTSHQPASRNRRTCASACSLPPIFSFPRQPALPGAAPSAYTFRFVHRCPVSVRQRRLAGVAERTCTVPAPACNQGFCHGAWCRVRGCARAGGAAGAVARVQQPAATAPVAAAQPLLQGGPGAHVWPDGTNRCPGDRAVGGERTGGGAGRRSVVRRSAARHAAVQRKLRTRCRCGHWRHAHPHDAGRPEWQARRRVADPDGGRPENPAARGVARPRRAGPHDGGGGRG